MKKFAFIALALIFIGETVLADLNIKIGIDSFGRIKTEVNSDTDTNNTDTGVSIIIEYLYPVHEIIKLGGGAEYQFPRKPDIKNNSNKLNNIPIYVSIQVYPVKKFPPAYIKGNIGYNFPVIENDNSDGLSGGLYYAAGAGCEFDCGVILEVLYGIYSFSGEYYRTVDYKHSKLGFNVGYKFKI